MEYFIEGHNFEDEVLSILQMFYPNQTYARKLNEIECLFGVKSIISDGVCRAFVIEDGKAVCEDYEKIERDDIKSIKRYIKLTLHNAIKKINPIEMPWGIITGIRPTKRIFDMWDKSMSDEEIFNELKDDYLVREDKIKLTMEVAKAERKILKNNNPNKIGFYIGIPFCPTRCLYCSFTSYTLAQYGAKVDLYLDALEKELEFLSAHVNRYELESLYIGGGTPTSLNEKQLDRFLSFVFKYIKKPHEFTFEAGRADTINREKLKILKDFGVNRISVNPQSMNEKTLKLIGREHSVLDFVKAFEMAREEGHEHINTDLILGLPEEEPEDVENTMKQIAKLNPESITVHTLAVKRASRLKETLENYELTESAKMQKMLEISCDYAKGIGMFPYYMYRQKNMIGNFENVGYCKEGHEGIYNIQIMEERQTIIAAGAGGSSKIYYPENNNVERIFNVKSVDDYITRIDEMIGRKASGGLI